MQKRVIAILMLAALILALIIAIAPTAAIVANETSGEIYGIGVFGLGQDAQDAKEPANQQIAGH